MNSSPFYELRYKGRTLPIHSKEKCPEFDGDCFKFAYHYIKPNWVQVYRDKNMKKHYKEYKSHVCTPEELVINHLDNGNIFLCPPDNLVLKNNFHNIETYYINFFVEPNFKNGLPHNESQKLSNDFQVQKYQLNGVFDQSKIGSPIIHKAEYYGMYIF